ncbi:MAG: response regulator [Gammaproteobacteria bacterium]|nr:response regulator [Gammaproteobacteria bacterium]
MLALITWPRRLNRTVTASVKRYGAQYLAYGLFGCLNAPFYYLIWCYITRESYESLALRVVNFTLCLGLVLHKQWPKKLQPLLPLYWVVTLWFTLPFFFAFLLVMNHGSTMWIANNIVIVFFILLLLDYRSAIIILLTGSLSGMAVAGLLLPSGVALLPPTFNTLGFLLTYLVAIVIGSLFSHNREKLEVLQRRTLQLEAESKEKSAFIANMSHDLRTPLSGLLTLSAINRRELPDTHPLQQKLTMIHQSAQQLHQLFESLLETAKLDQSATVNSVTQPFCLATLIKEIVGLFQPTLTSKGLVFYSALPATDTSFLKGHALVIRRVLINLISNAIKFTEHGTITLNAEIQGNDGNNNTTLIIAVSDTGCGIEADDQEKIFKAFGRLTPAYKQNHYAGVGLGLYNARKMLHAIGGRMDVRSAGNNQGSTFTCRFPLQQVAPVSDTTAPAKHSTANNMAPNTVNPVLSKPWRILLVEDNPTASMAATHVLTAVLPHCHIDRADTAKKARDQATQQVYDLVLMDLGLPDGDGCDVAHYFRTAAASKNHAAAIMALTAHGNEDIRHACLKVGINQVLNKPLLAQQAKQLVEQYGQIKMRQKK